MDDDSSQLFPPFGGLKSEWDRWGRALDPMEWLYWASYVINSADLDTLSFSELKLMCDLIDRRDEKLKQWPTNGTIN